MPFKPRPEGGEGISHTKIQGEEFWAEEIVSKYDGPGAGTKLAFSRISGWSVSPVCGEESDSGRRWDQRGLVM